ncbi:MAG: hypothetical protein K6D96_04380 [Acetatifactor sp.]|nr:hypothetical protein [Acetatifactor sp.]
MKKISLKTKIVGIMAILFAASISIILALTVRVAKGRIADALVEQFVNEDKQVARQAEIILERGGTVDDLQVFVNDLIASNPDFAYAVVIDTTVTAIAHSDEQKIGKNYSDDVTYTVPACQKGDIKTSQFWADVQNAWTYDVMYPIYLDGQLYASMDVGIYNTVVDSVVTGVRTATIPLAVIFIVVIAILVFIFVKLMFREFNTLINFCDEISKGNLKVWLPDKLVARKDEIGRIVEAMINMRDNLGKLLNTTTQNSLEIADIAEKLAVTADDTKVKSANIVERSTDVSGSTKNQSELTKINATMVEEITKGMENIAESIEHVTDESHLTVSDAEKGNKQLKEAVNQMNVIEEHVSVTYKKMLELADMSNTIEEVVKLIADISGQTNLLALNASIEAARAGEQGKGFAVVAEEVGKLADESGEATKKIGDIISDIHNSIQESVSLMDEGNRSVELGIDLTKKAQEFFDGIKERIDNVTNDITSVAAVTEQVSANTSNLCNSMEQISDLAETISSSTEEVTGLATVQEDMMDGILTNVNSLQSLTDDLKGVLATFTL